MSYSWSRPLFAAFYDNAEELATVMSVSIQGVLHVSRATEQAEAAEKYRKARSNTLGEPYDEEAGRERIARAEEIASFARREVEQDFRTIVGHACVATWSALEAFVEDLIVACLENHPNLMEHDAFAKLRVPFAEFIVLTDDERRRMLVQELERSSRSSYRLGVARFESMLEAVGLSGPAPEDCRKTLLELSEVRNCLVHRSGKADRRLLRLCPWLGLELGATISLGMNDFDRYSAAIAEYVLALAGRARIVPEDE